MSHFYVWKQADSRRLFPGGARAGQLKAWVPSACKRCRHCTFSTPFLPAVGSLAHQILRRLRACRVLLKCRQLVLVLRQVRVWGTSECPMFQHGFLKNAVSHGYNGFISLCSHPLLPNRRRSVSMLWRVSEKATDDVLPVGSHCGIYELWVWSRGAWGVQ